MPGPINRTGAGYVGDAATIAARTLAGHPKGYLEAFANIYCDIIADIRRVQAGEQARRNFPGVDDGIRSMRFVKASVDSSRQGAVWVDIWLTGVSDEGTQTFVPAE